MGIYHPLRRTGVRVTVTVLCLLVLSGVAPKIYSGWILKPLFSLNWFSIIPSIPGRPPKELLTGLLCVTGYVRKALVTVENERTSVDAEREAFVEFADSVRRLDASPQRAFDAPTAAVVSASADHEQLERIQHRYRETVMSVPGYERTYGETLEENMAAEFGDELAVAVLEGQQFTPQLKGLLVSQAEAAATQRESLLKAIDGERCSLTEADERLKQTETEFEGCGELELTEKPFEALVEGDEALRRNERQCSELLRDRQREIHREDRWLRGSGAASLQGYLYRNLDVQFPALNAGLERIKQLRSQRRTIARVIARLD